MRKRKAGQRWRRSGISSACRVTLLCGALHVEHIDKLKARMLEVSDNSTAMSTEQATTMPTPHAMESDTRL
jgi:hypothetical protein